MSKHSLMLERQYAAQRCQYCECLHCRSLQFQLTLEKREQVAIECDLNKLLKRKKRAKRGDRAVVPDILPTIAKDHYFKLRDP